MKYILLVTVLALAGGHSLMCQAQANSTAIAADAYGAISTEALLAQYPQFAAEYTRYQPDAPAIEKMQSLHGLQLVVLFGSWCHDSEREVPRLLKLLQQSQVAIDSLQLHAVNRQKQHPQQLHTNYGLVYTPTIIVLQHGHELGRIIERPQQSLAEDLAEIASKAVNKI
ncbi:MAG TPA: thioredoxin family protein [Rheinheimera sp.]|nr:thioredoxin family protein [Rheinheimera sp.]